MLQKLPKKSTVGLKGIIRGAIIVETALFFGAGAVWYSLCNSPGFRLTMYKHCRPVLNGFYNTLERFSGNSPRLGDYKKWNVTEESQT